MKSLRVVLLFIVFIFNCNLFAEPASLYGDYRSDYSPYDNTEENIDKPEHNPSGLGHAPTAWEAAQILAAGLPLPASGLITKGLLSKAMNILSKRAKSKSAVGEFASSGKTVRVEKDWALASGRKKTKGETTHRNLAAKHADCKNNQVPDGCDYVQYVHGTDSGGLSNGAGKNVFDEAVAYAATDIQSMTKKQVKMALSACNSASTGCAIKYVAALRNRLKLIGSNKKVTLIAPTHTVGPLGNKKHNKWIQYEVYQGGQR